MANATAALLVGTVSGVYITPTDPRRLGQWTRLGTLADLPLVLTMGLSHEPHSDTLVAATFGRGVYVMRGATAVLVAHRLSSVLCADRVAVLVDGRLVQLGTPAALAREEGWFRRNFYPDVQDAR